MDQTIVVLALGRRGPAHGVGSTEMRCWMIADIQLVTGAGGTAGG